MNLSRPDPDALLDQFHKENRRDGRLRIFLGAAPGVGKTYAMLQAARVRQAQGRPVLIGYVETHGRTETEELLKGQEILQVKETVYRGIRLYEFDLDAALAQKPDTIIVDELAHTNAPGSRHAKRWQDVLELLGQGINVWTTVNIQHIESLNDSVERITGIRVKEVVPNHVWERADAVELIDLPPEELIERLKAGKVYIPDTIEHALDGFFRIEKLIALRELSLRQTAQRVDRQFEDSVGFNGAVAPKPTAGERILVSVGPGPFSARLIRSAKIMADELHARWYAVTIDTSERNAQSETDKERIRENIHMANQLGAETYTLAGEKISTSLLDFAREHRITRIIIGKPLHSRWKDLLKGSLLNEVIRGSGDIDVHVITGLKSELPSSSLPIRHSFPEFLPFLWAILIVAFATGINHSFKFLLELQDFVMVFLLGVVVTAFRCGFWPAALASLLSVGAFDFFFIPPYYNFSVNNPMHIVTFAVMLAVSFVIANLAGRSRTQAESARINERETHLHYVFARRLAEASDVDSLARVVIELFEEDFKCKAEMFLDDPSGFWLVFPKRNPENEEERNIAKWVKENSLPAGKGTQTFMSERALYLPITTGNRAIGVLAMVFNDEIPSPYIDPKQRRRLETLTRQVGLTLERMLLEQEARENRLRADAERLRNALLSSLSHDLRTPLASIIGAATTQLTVGDSLPREAYQELNQAILDEAERMNRLVNNLLDMTRLASGSLTPKCEWLALEDIIGSALRRMEKQLKEHIVKVNLGDLPPFLWADSLLIEQVLVNLLDNAAKYTPPGTVVEIHSAMEPHIARIIVEDSGPGFSAEEAERLFDKFYRGVAAKGKSGSGLGLGICRGIVETHGGRIWAEPRKSGGARFVMELPQDKPPIISDEFESIVETDEKSFKEQ